MVPLQGANARIWRVLQVNHSLVGWTAPSEVQGKHTSKAGCALFICVERSQLRIAFGLMVNNTDLSLAGMTAPCQVQRQPISYSTREAIPPSPRAESLLEDCINSSATIIEEQREENTKDIDAFCQITDELASRRQHKME